MEKETEGNVEHAFCTETRPRIPFPAINLEAKAALARLPAEGHSSKRWVRQSRMKTSSSFPDTQKAEKRGQQFNETKTKTVLVREQSHRLFMVIFSPKWT